jgi:hypothetical protein
MQILKDCHDSLIKHPNALEPSQLLARASARFQHESQWPTDDEAHEMIIY